ncbi:MAG: hypothetical protein ACK41E_12320, partial [Deinococcales bacterium]
IRKKYGLLYAMLAHAIDNAIFSVPAVLLAFASKELLDGKTENLSGGDIIIQVLIGIFYLVVVVLILWSIIYSLIEHRKYTQQSTAR